MKYPFTIVYQLDTLWSGLIGKMHGCGLESWEWNSDMDKPTVSQSSIPEEVIDCFQFT
jgi:hypothetical protein